VERHARRFLVNLKTIKTADPDLTTVQKNVATALASIPGQAADNFVTTRDAQYRITGEETHVFIDASSNAVTVVLPTTGRAPVIKRIDNSVFIAWIQAADRKLIDGTTLYPLAGFAKARPIFDGRAWWIT
jgi:hypothetical protein